MHQFVLFILIYLARVTAWHAIVKKVQEKKMFLRQVPYPKFMAPPLLRLYTDEQHTQKETIRNT